MADAITVSCPSCRTTFPVDPDKVPTGGVNARCSECEDIFRVEAPLEDVTPEPAEPGGGGSFATEAEPPGAGIAPPAEEETVAAEEEWGATKEESLAAEEETGFDDYFSRTDAGAGTGTTATEEAPEESPAGEGPALDEAFSPTEEAAEPLPELEEETGPGEEEDEEEVGEPLPGLEESGLEEPGYETRVVETEEPDETEEPAVAGGDEPAVAEPAPGGAATAETDGPAAAETEPQVEKPRPTFGNRSPEEKAQRLARVLVSDMITYNPTMYETALARGTLKEDFADEIEKSWEEYVEQVGEDLATSTSHWTDALNDILAKGEQTF